MHVRRSIAAFCCAFALSSATAAIAAEAVDFDRDVRGIFAKHCLSCHGEDMAEGSLRLDRRDAAFEGGNTGAAIVPGDSAASRLIEYVTGQNADEVIMPPEGEPLSAAEIDTLRRWIDAGAVWPTDDGAAAKSDHWSFQPVVRARPPATRHEAWVRNEIDRFVVARLESEGIEPSREADRATLIRRLSIDLLGLPPTPEEVDEFVQDTAPDAYERLVDRLLASPHHGERWGRHWLDLARYADSDGYEKDTGRPHAWRYRQWVIDALNRDMPFDEFTIQQLAGDLLPDSVSERLVATGFHRNTLRNREGGVDQEEFRVAATVDRANTTGSVWLGLTVGCAQCHSHKYDPISQREYYGLYAFFNNLDEVDVAAPSEAQLADYEIAKAEFEKLHLPFEEALAKYESDELPKRQAEWEASLSLDRQAEWHALDDINATTTGNVRLIQQADGSLLAFGASPAVTTYTLKATSPLKTITAIRVELLRDKSLPKRGPGRGKTGSFVLTDLKLSFTDADGGSRRTTVAKLANAMADESGGRWQVAAGLDTDDKSGWKPAGGKPHVAVFELEAPIELSAASRQLTLVLDQQYGQRQTIGRFRVSVTGEATPFAAEGVRGGIAELLAIPAMSRSDEQRQAVAAYYRAHDARWRTLRDELAAHALKAPADPRIAIKAQALVETDDPRETHILVRGSFLDLGAKVEPHVLSVLPALESSGSPDRLALARWLVDPANPLTSRVMVNRVWARHFGRGLVATEDDFGTQGEKPSHPELLDWLASEFIRQGWSLKSLHKLIVTSATYRQSSEVDEALAARDPYNVLLARQRRLRVEAELIRDMGLAASGMLRPAVGGPSVRPPQPAGISELSYANAVKWKESQGADRYRRGMYTWFQRTSPYPMLMTFDAPDTNVSCARRERSNTPLQALVLLNDPVFFEFAQGLAARIAREARAGGDTAELRDARLERGFRLCVSRKPEAQELADLRNLYESALAAYTADPDAAAEMLGSRACPDGVSTAELASLVVIGRTLMNLDEFITRE